ncbi:MAG TPA: NAD(P)H-dependent oxidoreductase [Opitutus sp.]|nr:NAD(P)H-dependent oxidoreductase [Opitutus sp.]
MNILVVSGSLNSDSNSRLLAREAERALAAGGHNAIFLDLRELPLPLCDGENAYEHENVLRADKLIHEADGIIVATPIYNYDANAAVKNLVELTGDAWENKVVGFLCASGGASSFMSIMSLANSLMLDFRCVVVPRFVYATGAAFSGDKIVDSKITARVDECARATAHLAAAMKQFV